MMALSQRLVSWTVVSKTGRPVVLMMGSSVDQREVGGRQLPKSTGRVACAQHVAGGPAEHQLAQPGVTVGAHDQQIRAVRCSLGKQDFAGVAVRLVDWLRLNGNAMSPQHRRRSVEISCRFLADRAEDHRSAPHRNGSASCRARAASREPFQPAMMLVAQVASEAFGGNIRTGTPAAVASCSTTCDPSSALRSEHQVHGARRLGQKPLRFTLGFLPYHAGSRAADALEGGLDPLLDLLVDLPLRLDQFGQHIGQRLRRRRSG